MTSSTGRLLGRLIGARLAFGVMSLACVCHLDAFGLAAAALGEEDWGRGVPTPKCEEPRLKPVWPLFASA